MDIWIGERTCSNDVGRSSRCCCCWTSHSRARRQIQPIDCLLHSLYRGGGRGTEGTNGDSIVQPVTWKPSAGGKRERRWQLAAGNICDSALGIYPVCSHLTSTRMWVELIARSPLRHFLVIKCNESITRHRCVAVRSLAFQSFDRPAADAVAAPAASHYWLSPPWLSALYEEKSTNPERPMLTIEQQHTPFGWTCKRCRFFDGCKNRRRSLDWSTLLNAFRFFMSLNAWLWSASIRYRCFVSQL
jgi:hypothetical protein